MAVLVGRGAELRELLGAADAARAVGRGWVGLISGDAGIGKTRLAAEFAGRLQDAGVAVAWAVCRRDGGAPPYWLWSQLLGRLGRGDALAAPPTDDPVLARFLLFQSVGDAVCEAAPVLLVLDDLQWADEPSLRLLDALGAQVGSAPVLILGVYRDTDPDTAAFGTLAVERRLVLRGLPIQELAAIVAELTGETLTGEEAVALHRRTGGNPFFAAEVVRLQRAEGSSGAPPATSVPAAVRVVLDRRLDRLPDGVEDVLRAAGLVGAGVPIGVDVSLLAAVRERPPAALAAVLEPAVEAGLLLTDGSRYFFPHALVAETVAARSSAEVRLALHRRAGDVLRARAAAGDGDPAGAAYHLLAAARLSGESADACAAAAAGSLAARAAIARVAYEDAVRWLEDSLEVLATCPAESSTHADPPAAAPDRGDLLCALGEAALSAGDQNRARRAFGEAAEYATSRHRPDVLAAAALGLSGGAAGFEVDLAAPARTVLLEEALDGLPATDSWLRSAVLARLSVALSFTRAESRRRQLAEDAVAMARRVGDPRALGVALAAYCDALAGPTHVQVRCAAAEEIVECGRRARDLIVELLGHRLRFVAVAEAGNWGAADDEIRAYAAVSEPTGQPRLIWYLPLWRGTRAAMQGESAVMATQSAELHRMVELSGSDNARLLENNQIVLRAIVDDAPADAIAIMWELFFGIPASAEDRRGRSGASKAADATGMLERILEKVPDVASMNHPTVPLLMAMCGRTAPAHRRLATYVEALPDRVQDSEWLPEVVQAATTAILLRDRDAATAIYPLLEPYGDLFAVEGIGAATWGCVHAFLGGLAGVLDRNDDARRHFAAALRLNAAAGSALAERTRRWAAEFGTVTDLPTAGAPIEQVGTIRRDGEVWILEFGRRTVRLKDSKGLHDLALLLTCPGRDVAVRDLATVREHATTTGFDLADRTAIASYRRRLIDVEQEREEAAAMHDPARAERAAAERDALIEELSAVTGLGGQPRRAGSDTERMRKAVGNRIRNVVGRIERVHPELGRHLRLSVRTGTFCRYEPAVDVRWDVHARVPPG